MSSPLLTLMLIKKIEPLIDILSKGTLKAKIIGALIGGALAVPSVFVFWIEFALLSILLGSISGAIIAAAIFKKPLTGRIERTTDEEPFAIGAVLKTCAYANVDTRCLTVLMERAVYLARDGEMPWVEVLDKLSRGEDPAMPQGEILRLEELLCIEMNGLDALEFEIVHMPEGGIKRFATIIDSLEDRNRFFEALHQQLHRPFTVTERPMRLSKVIHSPVAFLTIVIIFVLLTTWLELYWMDNPPPPPRGGAEPTAIAKMMIAAGPIGVLAVGAVVTIPVLYWLVRSYVSPPQIVVIPLREDNVVVNN